MKHTWGHVTTDLVLDSGFNEINVTLERVLRVILLPSMNVKIFRGFFYMEMQFATDIAQISRFTLQDKQRDPLHFIFQMKTKN